jgi:hypothetical protein
MAAAIASEAGQLGIDLAAIPEMPDGRWQNTDTGNPD